MWHLNHLRRLTLGRTLAALLSFLAFMESSEAVAQEEGRQWALLIGVESYEKAVSLQYVSNDVIELSDALTRRAYFQDHRILRLYDKAPDREHHPNKANLEREIAEFLKLPKEQDSVIVYYSGHGFRDESDSLYLAPSDCDPKRPAETGIAARWLREQLANCAAQDKFLLLDSCHAGNEKGEDGEVRSDELMDVFRGLEGVATIASSTGEQKSLMWDDKRQSLFSYWLVQALKGHADSDADGVVSFDNTYHYVHSQVSQTARLRFGRSQTPIRIVRSGTLGDPEIIRLKPQPLKRVMSDVAEQIAWAMEFKRLPSIGVLEFTGKSDKAELLGGDFGLLGSYCAQELNDQLLSRASGRYSVIDNKRLHEALAAQRFQVADLGSSKSLQSLAQSVGGMPALVRGSFLNREGEVLNIRAEVVRTGNLEQPLVAGGVAALNESEWAMLGRSLVVESRVPSVDSDSEQGAVQSDTPSIVPVEEVSVESFDEESDQEHPNNREDFPFHIRVMVNGEERRPVSREGTLFVPLSVGEAYAIYIDYKNTGQESDRPAFMRLLVDGLNTHYESVTVKGVRTLEWGKRVNLSDAKAWNLDPKLRASRTWGMLGFHTDPTGNYKEFSVVGAAEGLAARQHYADSIGLITAAFYSPQRKREVRGIPGGISTGAGAEQARNLDLYQGDEEPGELLGVIHLRYATPEALGIAR